MALQHVETTITETSIRMRLANNADDMHVTEWIELFIPTTAQLSLPAVNGDIPLGPLHTRQLGAIQLAVLRYVRDAIGEETQRLASLSSS